MLASWTFDEVTLAKWEQLVRDNRSKSLPRRRYELNVRRIGIDLSKQNVWHALVGFQVTTQQRSGPRSAVSRFLSSTSLALDLAKCRNSKTLREFVTTEMTNAGLRRAPTIASNLATIWENLEAGEWPVLLKHLETLRTYPNVFKEKAVVNYLLGSKYPGLGQKQSRNFIQWLGVSRYEVPLDSRVLKKLKEFGASFVPSGASLTDEAVYLFVQDCLHQISRALDIYPCMLDACIFASFDITDETETGDN